MFKRTICCLLLLTTSGWSEERVIQTFEAVDSLNPAAETSENAKRSLEQLCWKPGRFSVTLEAAKEPYEPGIVRFPSPQPIGNATIDSVVLEWYAARNESQEIIDAPAIVVVHESGSGMVVGRLMANALHAHGLHAFMIQLPTYGLRRPTPFVPQLELVGTVLKQGIADARRARDAVAVLPHVDTRSISIQGTSLGGFVTATTAGIDQGFSTVHIMLAGGNLFDVLMNGNKETRKVREMITQAGLSQDQVRSVLAPIEPLTLAHRYRVDTTWLYTANRDQIVPPHHATLLREAAGLKQDHEITLPADHYSGIIYLPIITADINKKIRDELATRDSKP